MALRRSRSHRDSDASRTKGFAERIATATKPEPSGSVEGRASAVLIPGLTRYQRRTANLPTGVKPMTAEEATNIVIDLTDEDASID